MEEINLHQRFLNISKQILNYVKGRGFKKNKSKCFLEKGEFIFNISAAASKPWLNSNNSYSFHIVFEIFTKNKKFVQLYEYINNEKEIGKAPLIWKMILPDHANSIELSLKPNDPFNYDENIINGMIEKIDEIFLPEVYSLSTMEEVLELAEKEYQKEKSERFFYKNKNIYIYLEILYAYKDLKQKVFEMLNEEMTEIPETALDLVEKRKNKYIKYFKLNNI